MANSYYTERFGKYNNVAVIPNFMVAETTARLTEMGVDFAVLNEGNLVFSEIDTTAIFDGHHFPERTSGIASNLPSEEVVKLAETLFDNRKYKYTNFFDENGNERPR